MPTPTQDVDIDTAFQTELTRLLALNLSPEQEEIARRYYSQKERQSMPQSSFCGPGRSFPITNQADVTNAAHLVGHAADPAAVKKCIIGKAKANGWSIPDSWKTDGKRADTPDVPLESTPTIERADSSPDQEHEPTSAIESETEKTNPPDITRSLPSETSIYMPILRIDRAKREVILRATAEAFDSYGTVIGFDGSKEAFGKWRGNIREMHDPTKAVGRAVKWEPADEEKAIDLTLRVSRGAEDTWQKCLDGTLSGGSIGARNGKWGKRTIDGKEVPFLERYDLVEVSLVDNPSCPGCDVKVVRADGLINQDVLDDEPEEEEPRPAVEETRTDVPDTTRAGARISHVTQDALHSMRDGHLLNAKSTMQLCACDECMTGCSALDPDGDGDIDLMPTSMLDTDSDGGASGDGSGDGQSRAVIAEIIREEIGRQMSPTITRMNGIAARLAMTDTPPQTITTQVATPDPQLTRRLETIEQKLAELPSSADLTEVRSLVSEVKESVAGVKSLTEQIAAQPQSGGPIVNSAALQNQPQYMQPDPLQEDATAVARLAKAGILNKNQQIEAVLYLQRASQQGQNGRR